MRNPWLKKNPLLSMWLSGANTMFGVARGRANAEAKRQMASMMTQGEKQIVRWWADVLTPGAPKRRRRRT
jgi:hypothetical protein